MNHMEGLGRGVPPPEQAREESAQERVVRCLNRHVVDFAPKNFGNNEKIRELQYGLVGAAGASIDRCTPSIEVLKCVIEGGKSTAFFGPNGAGKSTVFDAFMERDHADFSAVGGAGAIYRGEGVHGKNTIRIARLDQEEMLSDMNDLTVEDVMDDTVEHFKKDFPIDWEDTSAYDRNMANQETHQRLDELSARASKLFEMEDFFTRRVSELSGGERTKLALLMVLASEPDVLLLDEPTNHLDLESIAKLMGIFELYKRAGIGIVNVSHVEWFLEQAGGDGTMELRYDGTERSLITSNSPYARYAKSGERRAVIAKGDIAWRDDYKIPPKGTTVLTSTDSFTVPASPLRDVFAPTIGIGDVAVFCGKNGTGKTKLMEVMYAGNKKIQRIDGFQGAYLPQVWPDEVLEGTVNSFFEWVKTGTNPNSIMDAAKFIRALRDIGFPESGSPLLRKRFSSFSGGEQRLMWFVATSVFEGTKALILDEPTNHMDAATTDVILQAIERFPGAVILSTHDLRLMEGLQKVGGDKTVRSIEFVKRGGKTAITERADSPLAYAAKTIARAKKEAQRMRF